MEFAFGADDRAFFKPIVNRDGPIHDACGRTNNLEDVKAYIAAGKDLDITNDQGRTLLHMAALFGRTECARLLLAAGADVTKKWQGMTALEMAKCNGHPECVALLKPLVEERNNATKARNASADPLTIDLFEAVEIGDVAAIQRAGMAAGADMNIRSSDKETPLHKAVLYDHLENQSDVVKVLVDAGADKNARRSGGWTPLHLAADHDHKECARVLIEAGADHTLTSDNGWTAFKIAKANGHAEIARMLEDAAKRGSGNKPGGEPKRQAAQQTGALHGGKAAPTGSGNKPSGEPKRQAAQHGGMPWKGVQGTDGKVYRA